MRIDTAEAEETAALFADMRKWKSAGKAPLTKRRAGMDAAEGAIPLPESLSSSPWAHAGVSGLKIESTAAEVRTILFVHGGGLIMGSSKSHRHLAGYLARAARSHALVVDYRLAPEHPFPAGLQDLEIAYASLRETLTADHIAVVADSAGGALALTLVQSLPKAERPGAMAFMSPWFDLTCRPLSDAERAEMDDPVVAFEDMVESSAQYCAGHSAGDPRVSPAFGDFTGLPPTMIQIGREELMFRETTAFIAACRGTSLTVQIETGLPHVWQWFWHRLASGRRSLDSMGQFLDARLAAG